MDASAAPSVSLFDELGEEIVAAFAVQRESVPAALLYGPDAAEQLAMRLTAEAQGRRALLFGDARTRAVAGAELERAMSALGWTCSWLMLPDGPDGAKPECDGAMRARCAAMLSPADVYVAVGSGVVNDLTKWLAAEQGVRYAVLATAASMNGYSAANAAPAIDGVKSLVHARAPRYVAAIPRVIETAPAAMTASGLGDLIARSVSTADWLMNHLLFGEPFSEPLAQAALAAEQGYLDSPQALARREPQAIRGLFEALIHSGCAMTLHGSSLPASGGEHLISHALDMMAWADGTGHDLHGRQVGVATIFTAALYQRVMSIEPPTVQCASAPLEPGVWKQAAAAVGREHARKVAVVQQACDWLGRPGAWERLRAALRPVLREPADLRERLKLAGAAWRLQDIGCSRERFVQAVTHCGAIRARFTSIDLGWITGILPGEAPRIVSEWLS